MANDIVTARDNIRNLMIRENTKRQILAAIPPHLVKERMFRIYLTAVQNESIAKCEPNSILNAVMQSAQLGLSIDSVMGESFIIPRWSKNVGGHVAGFQLGYKGLRKLALNANPDLRDIFSHVVYENDQFDYTLGLEPNIKLHKPAQSDRGEIIAAYAVAVWKDGYRRFEMYLEDDAKRSMEASDAWKRAERDKTFDSPWHQNPGPMWIKSVVRRLCSSMVLSADSPLHDALAADRSSSDYGEAIHVQATQPKPAELPKEKPAPSLEAHQPDLAPDPEEVPAQIVESAKQPTKLERAMANRK